MIVIAYHLYVVLKWTNKTEHYTLDKFSGSRVMTGKINNPKMHETKNRVLV